MRVLVKSPGDDFRVKAYAGTNGVLLAMDVAKAKRHGLLGFAIEKKVGAKWRFLLSSLTFPGKTHTIPDWNATPSDLAPIQKYRWADYTVEPGQTCQYRVHLAHHPVDLPELTDFLEVTVKADDGHPKHQGVTFNRAVAASQAFSRKFPDLDKLLTEDKNLPIEKWPAEPRDWLQHHLLDRLLEYVARAKDGTWALDVAIYEYELAAIVDAVDAAHKRGVDVRVIYHAQKNDDQTEANEKSLKKIPKANKRARVTSKIFHDKFIVLSRLEQGERVPQAVLCGSTNFTENGLYRQANVVHVVDDRTVAQQYLDVFKVVWDSPSDVGTARAWITEHNPMDATVPFFAGYSPRKGGGDLTAFIDIMNGAQRDLLFATAFRLPKAVLDALLGKAHDDVVRYGIQNSASSITGYHADRSADFAATALLTTGLEGWVKEGLHGQRGNLLIHTKAVVVDFTSDSPTVISGSHNLGTPASYDNDENYLIMRGDTDLADRYGLELLRFYDHYRFRYYAKLLRFKEAQPLAVDDSWSEDYYQAGNLKALARERFAGR